MRRLAEADQKGYFNSQRAYKQYFLEGEREGRTFLQKGFPSPRFSLPHGVRMIDVVAGIVWRGAEYLAVERPAGTRQAGFWEFPGGKVETGESLETAPGAGV